MKKIAIISLVVFISLVAVASSQAKNLVLSQGTSYVHDGRVDIARDAALENALRNVVEKSVGVLVTSTTQVEDFEVKLDTILAESRGFINSYEVVSEERQGDTFKITIEADVGLGKLKNKMAAINLVMLRKSKPRLMIMFNKKTRADRTAESSMSKVFLSNGFKVIDAETVKNNMKHERLEALATNDKAVRKLGHRYGAEIMIIGSIEFTSRSVTVDKIEMQINNAVASVKAVKVDTGYVIASDNAVRTAPGGAGGSRSIVEDIGSTLAENIMDQIVERASSELTNTVTVKLLASGLKSYTDLSKFKSILKTQVRGIKHLFQRSFARGRVELDIEIRGNTLNMADDIASIKMRGRKVKIVEITQNKIVIKLLP